MKALIFALATALPQYNVDQATIAQKLIDTFQLEGKPAQFVKNLSSKTQIKKRYSVLDDFEKEPEERIFFNKDYLRKTPGTKLRNEIYIKEAPILAKKAAQKAIEQWGQDPKKITHVISVSCTGIMAPGIELILQKELNLSNSVQRLGINFMGCFGAFRGLAAASALAKENPNNRVLLVCTELCSLHVQFSQNPEVMIGNLLFGDGAAAVVVGADPNDQEKGLLAIEKFDSAIIEETQNEMTWVASDHGFVMRLTKEVPIIIEQSVPRIIKSILSTQDFNEINWAIHPGGKAIVEAIEHGCGLTKEQTKASWDVLANYGNMSSATFLFVLNEMIQNNKLDKQIFGVGFGPGLSLETVLLSPC